MRSVNTRVLTWQRVGKSYCLTSEISRFIVQDMQNMFRKTKLKTKKEEKRAAQKSIHTKGDMLTGIHWYNTYII
jgi:hypothetical protein